MKMAGVGAAEAEGLAVCAAAGRATNVEAATRTERKDFMGVQGLRQASARCAAARLSGAERRAAARVLLDASRAPRRKGAKSTVAGLDLHTAIGCSGRFASGDLA
jgi:hypothetical protein